MDVYNTGKMIELFGEYYNFVVMMYVNCSIIGVKLYKKTIIIIYHVKCVDFIALIANLV